MDPAVSVIVTSLNRPEYLRASCASVLAQEYEDFEVLICDDASDNHLARQAAADLADQDPRVRVIQNTDRLGQYKTICKASTQMRGRHFAILNDDDLWSPGFLAKLVAPLEADAGLVAAFCDHHIIGGDGQIDPVRTEATSQQYKRAALRGGRHENGRHLAFGVSAFPTVVATLFRSSAVDWERYRGASMDVIGMYDLWLHCCLFAGPAPVWYERERLSSYRVHDQQLSGTPNTRLARARAWIWEEALDSGEFADVEQMLLRDLSATHQALGMAYLRRGQRRLARTYLWRACSRSPRAKAALGLIVASSGPVSRAVSKRRVRP